MRTKILFFLIVLLSCIPAGTSDLKAADAEAAAAQCMVCHKEKTPGLYHQWFNSAHGQAGVNCIHCHGAKKSDTDAFMHYDALIATIVTPIDCGQCHDEEMEEMERSHHANAGLILESADAYLANVVGGYPAVIQGCESCHGGKVLLDPQSPNKLSMKSWPNSGIGRLNPDGSKGSCNACHTRHNFSRAQARQPESCSKCHLGPDHPQKEVYEESKHGNTYYTNIDQMNLKADKWVVGEDYFVAPTCSTCHMSATSRQKVSHDVGNRISWTLRPSVSVKLENWEKKRENMKDVCRTCHARTFVNGHFFQYDASVHLYNEKFAKPAGQVMAIVKKNNLLENQAGFANEIEWIYWELWHHEGRRARHGAAMMGPDYTWWHGFYEVGKHFYFKFIPEARKLAHPEVNAFLDKLLEDDPMHHWMEQPTDKLKQRIKSGELQKVYNSLFEQK